MIEFYATTGKVTLPYAQDWTPEQWRFMEEQARINPALAGTVVADGILRLAPQGKAGYNYSEIEVALWLGSAWTGPTINLGGTVTLEPGETQTPDGVIGPQYTGPAALPPAPPPTISGAIPPGPTDNVFPAPTTIPTGPITTVPAIPATGGQPSAGTAVPEIATASVAPNVTGIPQWIWLLALVGAIYFFTQEQ
jgi:hypothetical protein